ncbi:hypothetical protein GGX14DRAFT_539526 [Mycena pura]|uniref:Hyaluronan/mRNA-binding protein domain-containing protein n=1 Tax=Mycena pura TaxID=153505 RepID=A0AAD6YP84_9AGAR|nr:hypothetical protein GGX14DRAFT_539526 [Mycena pura]
MSVATKNPFALLEAEDASRSSSPVPAPAPAAAPAAPAPARGAQKSKGGPAARGGKYYARGGAKSAVRAEDLSGTGNLNQNGVEDSPTDKRFDARGRGRGGSRGSRGGRGRQFDKHSQTGKVDTEKRVNQGWGADEGSAELKAEQGAVNDANAEAAAPAGEWGAPAADAGDWSSPAAGAADWNSPAAAGDAGDAAPAATADGTNAERDSRPRREREPEEEDNTLTLDQYLAQQKEKESSVVPKLEGIRKANEGADGNIWKDAVALEKSEEDTYFVGKSRAAPKVRAKKEEKVFLEIDARFERPRGGGRGGRGGDERGGRARGGRGHDRGRAAAPRGGRSAASAPTVDVGDERAFPSLS